MSCLAQPSDGHTRACAAHEARTPDGTICIRLDSCLRRNDIELDNDIAVFSDIAWLAYVLVHQHILILK
jgi:hypothetical protein